MIPLILNFQPKKSHKFKSLRDQALKGSTYHFFLFGLRFLLCPQKGAFQTLTQAPETVTLPFRFTQNSYLPPNYILPG
uniref:Uncharacterized protein n=1 Tax=Uncultured archaeon GZfos26G2 TaxID=3386331 RepID=Q648H3_UNCAG|nr:hypothetical protein GZ37D1_51 [uncultured archaeon GZfos37D1]